MDIYYLSENIYLRDDKLYRNNKLIKKYDWHKKLSELGWTKLSLPLIKLLNTYSDTKYKNSQYGMLECGRDGSCFFHCIAYALNTNEIYKGEPYVYNSQDLRNILANSITNKLFDEIIEIYKILKDNDELYDTWDPYTIKVQEFKNLITNESNVFWGDHILIGLLMKELNINIIILNSNEFKNIYNIYNTMEQYDPEKFTILLIYENESHFKLLGHFQETNMITYFSHRTLPKEIYKMFK
tara:strand:- start:11226 stop:11945 length:720 start_codon:yes stop_codon:yes gene_type:complete